MKAHLIALRAYQTKALEAARLVPSGRRDVVILVSMGVGKTQAAAEVTRLVSLVVTDEAHRTSKERSS